jgi:hypothetical protein
MGSRRRRRTLRRRFTRLDEFGLALHVGRDGCGPVPENSRLSGTHVEEGIQEPTRWYSAGGARVGDNGGF